jgi:hypothetical protein
MLELMNPVGLELGVARRREVAQSTMRDARASRERSRRAASSALMIVSDKIGGQEATPRPTAMQPTGDCG